MTRRTPRMRAGASVGPLACSPKRTLEAQFGPDAGSPLGARDQLWMPATPYRNQAS